MSRFILLYALFLIAFWPEAGHAYLAPLIGLFGVVGTFFGAVLTALFALGFLIWKKIQRDKKAEASEKEK